MLSDDGLREMLRDRKDHFDVARKVREVPCRKMSKKAYSEWKKKAFELDDDTPLSRFV